MQASGSELRFGVRAVSGRCAATWRVWNTGGSASDVYLACRSIGGHVKASLHQSGSWHVAVSKHSFDTAFRGTRPSTRFADKWARPSELRPGFTHAYSIVVPWFSATSRLPANGDAGVIWVPPASEGRAVEFSVLLTAEPAAPGQWPGQRSMNTELVGTFPLPSGEHVWVVWNTQKFGAIPPLAATAQALFVGSPRRLLPPQDRREVRFAHTPAGLRAIYDLPRSVGSAA